MHRHADPFQDYKERLARRLRAKGELASDVSLASGIDTPGANSKRKATERDDVNWFGVKLDKDKDQNADSAKGSGGGVGKYLASPAVAGAGTKRPAEPALGAIGIADDDGGKKKRKLGFGNFDSW